MSYPELALKTTHIGSVPFMEVERALEIAFSFDIPAWPQLAKFKEEGMLWQFLYNFPGFQLGRERIIADTPSFEEEVLKLYETYVEVVENQNLSLLKAIFSPSFSKAFLLFLEEAKPKGLSIIKGQITGPFTLGIALKTEKEEPFIFREDLRDLLLRYLILVSLSQASYLKEVAREVIIFLDEPGLSGFGSSAYVSLSKELENDMLKEIIRVLKDFGILVGIHICANTSWDILLELDFDIINLDSFSYFDRFEIYENKITEFLAKGTTYLAFGAVPTTSNLLEKVAENEIISKVKQQILALSKRSSFQEEDLLRRILFTPACGMGSLREEEVYKVLNLMKALKQAFSST